MHFEEYLNKADDTQALWVSPGSEKKANNIKDDIAACRQLTKSANTSRVQVEVESTIDALVWIIALDGIAESVFLVPQSLAKSSDYDNLKILFEPTMCIDNLGKLSYGDGVS